MYRRVVLEFAHSQDNPWDANATLDMTPVLQQ
jgi:hypothetical protein